jgi:glycolate oxidase FAD binding subunit
MVAHRHGDLTATIQAGASLLDVNRALARHGQWLPIDTAFDRATIGGVIATNDAGALRHRFGTPRDLLIGITLALTDGRLVKAGGHVVKNVAGYDLGRFMSGSHGTLAAIVDATFKLLPMPAVSKTIVARFGDAAALAKGCAAVRATDLEPMAFDIHVAPGEYWLLLRFATSPAAADAQVIDARARLGDDTGVLSGADERGLWDDHHRGVWRKPGAVVRVSWMPAAIDAVLAVIESTAQRAGVAVELVGRAGVGAGTLRIDGADVSQADVIRSLRAHPQLSHVVVLRGSSVLKGMVDVWAMAGELEPVYRSLKRTFDPEGILNAGRGPI